MAVKDENSQGQMCTSVQFEQYKLVEDKTRFVMTRYMQAVALYLALGGFALKEIVTTQSNEIAVAITFLVSCLNTLCFYLAWHFRKMADHAISKQADLARQFNLQPPYPLAWGYHAGLICMSLNQIAIIAITYMKIR